MCEFTFEGEIDQESLKMLLKGTNNEKRTNTTSNKYNIGDVVEFKTRLGLCVVGRISNIHINVFLNSVGRRTEKFTYGVEVVKKDEHSIEEEDIICGYVKEGSKTVCNFVPSQTIVDDRDEVITVPPVKDMNTPVATRP